MEELDEIFERALQEIEENIDKLPLTTDVLRAYRIAKSEIYAVHQREECIIALYSIIEQRKREGEEEVRHAIHHEQPHSDSAR